VKVGEGGLRWTEVCLWAGESGVIVSVRVWAASKTNGGKGPF
jgi:hypothetical protein